MNKLVLDQYFVQATVNLVRLVRVHCPSTFEVEFLLQKLFVSVLLYHELSSHLIPSLFPINTRVQNDNCHIVNSGVHPDKSEPTILHSPEFVVVDYQSVVVKLVFIHRPLLIKLNRILRAEFMDWNHVLFDSLYFRIALYVPFERTDKETVRTLLNLVDLYVFWRSQILPLLGMLYVQFLWDITDSVYFRRIL